MWTSCGVAWTLASGLSLVAFQRPRTRPSEAEQRQHLGGVFKLDESEARRVYVHRFRASPQHEVTRWMHASSIHGPFVSKLYILFFSIEASDGGDAGGPGRLLQPQIPAPKQLSCAAHAERLRAGLPQKAWPRPRNPPQSVRKCKGAIRNVLLADFCFCASIWRFESRIGQVLAERLRANAAVATWTQLNLGGSLKAQAVKARDVGGCGVRAVWPCVCAVARCKSCRRHVKGKSCRAPECFPGGLGWCNDLRAAEALADFLKVTVNTTLRIIRLAENGLGDEGVQAPREGEGRMAS